MSRQAGLPDGSKTQIFLDSPTDLEKLFSVSSLALEKKFNCCVIDSLNALFSLNAGKEAEVINFAEKIANKIRSLKTKAVFLATDIQTQRRFIDEVAVFADKVLDFGKKKF